ncbi:helix-turn-helix domain-containing protein [Photobacterium damselae]|uniref:helix-turn-helix domain-containing protein n=1 Tax=Photobacterium damselae TaxID=38293 RepID=UPI000D8350B0|nr:helix-turn-helix transcriptional regulator [Photobacterium damselae]NVO73623.1 helix-turn-helix domain-containing protein [Photobacterium damselae subsp. damselae]SPY31282.1 transcriptional regulator, y4mF family [Photobacterium damselae]
MKHKKKTMVKSSISHQILLMDWIYKKIAFIREQKKISALQMAKSINVTINTYVNIERGRCDIKLDNLILIAHYLDVCPSSLLNREHVSLSSYSTLELLIELSSREFNDHKVKTNFFMYDRLREIRQKKCFSQKYMTEILNCSQDHYLKIESGKRSPRLNFYAKLVSELEIHPNFLIHGTSLSLSKYNELEIINELNSRYNHAYIVNAT